MDTEFLEASTAQENAPPSTDNSTPDVDEKVSAFVTDWTKRIKDAKKKRYDEPFKRMDQCMKLAKDGADEKWTQNSDRYVVAIVNRLINQAVSQLYAKNPTVQAKRKKRRMWTVWDGQLASLKEAGDQLQQSVLMTGAPDPNAAAIVQDALNVKKYDIMMDGVADTMTILHNHFMQDSAAMYKQQMKAMVRRTKVCSVAYVKVGFQRILEEDPDVRVKLDDATERLATMRRLLAEQAKGDVGEDSADAEQLQTLIGELQSQLQLIVQEGPTLSFPKSKSIIIDPACVHLKTLAGAGWVAEEYEKTTDEIMEIWKKDVKGSFTQYKQEDGWANLISNLAGDEKQHKTAKVWRVMNRKTSQEFVICDGYKDYLQAPAAPKVRIRRFFDIFPVVFNEIEDDKDLFPPSDVWLCRHLQAEYNRSREGLREHRQQNRPAYITGRGSLEQKDLDKLQTHASGEIIELQQLTAGEKIADKLQAKPVMQIDAKQYEVDSIWNDMMRVVGAQQADLGPTSGATATETSIANQSHTDTISDARDDVDDVMSGVAQAVGEVMLLNMTKESVVEIVGPGAVWPESEEMRQQIAEEISLNVRAGSSGRPNQAADLAKMERAMPFVLQLPGVNPIPWSQKYLDLLEVDAEDAIVEGLPSINALNAMAAKAASAAPAGPGSPPEAQGPAGGQNAPAPQGTPPGPQPGFPAPHMAVHPPAA